MLATSRWSSSSRTRSSASAVCSAHVCRNARSSGVNSCGPANATASRPRPSGPNRARAPRPPASPASKPAGPANASGASAPSTARIWSSPPPSRRATPAPLAPRYSVSSPATAAATAGAVGAAASGGRDPLQPLDALARLALAVARGEQLLLVALAVGGVEHRRADDLPAHLGVDEHGQPAAVGADDVQRDLAHAPLHPQQRRVVRLVIDPPAARQQLGEALAADELVAPVAGPAQERGVDAHDQPVGIGGQVAAGRVLVEVLGALVGRRRARQRKARMAAIVASGALRFGQCPVASSSSYDEPPIA